MTASIIGIHENWASNAQFSRCQIPIAHSRFLLIPVCEDCLDPESLLQSGQLEEALVQLKNQVRNSPNDSKLRVFLFQLLCLVGDWEKAQTQLEVCGELDAATLAMVNIYRPALLCEKLRQSVFDGSLTPLILGEPADWMGWLIQALKADPKSADAVQLRSQAFEVAPAYAGTIDGVPFEWICDSDSRLGPVLEIVCNGKYYWLPFANIRQLDIVPPEDLRDLVWISAHLILVNGGEIYGLIPTRYVGSEKLSDNTIRMSRQTTWDELSTGQYRGYGQRMFATDSVEKSILEIRQIIISQQQE